MTSLRSPQELQDIYHKKLLTARKSSQMYTVLLVRNLNFNESFMKNVNTIPPDRYRVIQSHFTFATPLVKSVCTLLV
jgi:hypothetical protein